MLASRVTKTLTEVPGFTGTVVIRKLAGRHLETARQEKALKFMEAFERMKKFQSLIESAQAPAEAKEPAVVAEHSTQVLDEFDKYVVVAKGVVEIDGQSAPADLVDDLGDEELDYLHEQILRLSIPRRFVADAEAERKNA